MARSELSSRRFLRGVLGATFFFALPIVVACNSILGLSDFDKGPCPGGPCVVDSGPPDQMVDAAVDVRVDAKGADPVSWAKWPMPNYFGDAGADGQVSSPPLVLLGETVTDPTTKLVWRSKIAVGDPTAAEAEGLCQALPNGPWRAPKRIELVTLLDYARKSFIDTTKFSDMKNYKVWTTSEVRPLAPVKADQRYWIVDFGSGAVDTLGANDVAKALCVRAK